MIRQPAYPLVTAREFLEFDFADRKAELDEGVIRVLDGVTARHSIVQGNILLSMRKRLRGSAYGIHSSQMAIRTHDLSVRRADASIFENRGGSENDEMTAFDDPRVLFEVLSAGTARTDLRVKLEEYKALDSVDTIVFVDIATERLRIVQRTAAHGWSDVVHDAPVDVALPALDLTIPHDEIFARD